MDDLEKHVPVNPQKGEVPLPEAGEGAFLKYDMDALERLEGKYGEEYIDVILKGLARVNVKVYQTVIGIGLRVPEGHPRNGDIPYGLSFEDLQARILDAFYMTIHGRTYLQQKEHEDSLMEERIGELKSDPRMASFLSSMPPGAQGTEQA